MEQLSPTYLREMLEVLRDAQVASFSCPLFSVNLLPYVERSAQPDTDIEKAMERVQEEKSRPRPAGVIGHSSLWPNGFIPDFPKAK